MGTEGSFPGGEVARA